MTKYRILGALSILIIILDQLSKAWILREYSVGASTPVVPGFLNITYVQNSGAAFGLLSGAEPKFRIPFFTVVPLIALIAIGYVFRRLPAKDIKLSSALSLVIGGATGNLMDRVRSNHVVDFLDFHWKHAYHFPAFNIADSAICVGVGILLIHVSEEKSFNASASI